MSLPVWILVANGSRARLLQRTPSDHALTELRDWVHPATRQHRQDLPSGHRQSGIRGRSGLAERSTLHDRERTVFAEEIGHWMAHALRTQPVGRVALFASKPFLGDLIGQAHNGWPWPLCATHALDLTGLPLPELERRLHQDFGL